MRSYYGHPPACTCVRCEQLKNALPSRAARTRIPKRPYTARRARKARRARRLVWAFVACLVVLGWYLYNSNEDFRAGSEDFRAESTELLSSLASSASSALEKTEQLRGSDDNFLKSPERATLEAVERDILILTNEARAAHGRPSLQRVGTIDGIARSHSEDMLSKGYFSHDSPSGLGPTDRALRAGYPCDKGSSYGLAENIFTISGIHRLTTETAKQIVNGWMTSPGHRANILDYSYGQIGVGVAFRSRTMYATQNFC